VNVLLIFSNTRAVIKAEALCRNAGLEFQVVAIPRDVSAECGMALSLKEDASSRALELLNQAGLSVTVHKADRAGPSRFDLLSTVESGGCSAKLPAGLLASALRSLPAVVDERLLVGLDTADDAGVYKLTDEIALIQTTDFFPPVCSDAFDFGQIAAANALSDVYAMGGRVLSAMNIVLFPQTGIPMEVLHEILRGGQEKVVESGGVLLGGHSIVDPVPKYGLAVTGVVHPDRVVTNAGAKPGELLILAKPIGTGVLVAGWRVGEARRADYELALMSMKQLNRRASEAMQRFSIRCATDVTGFGLLGHGLHMAQASHVTLEIDSSKVPSLPGVLGLIEMGCIPGASFRNLEYVEPFSRFDPALPYARKMFTVDPQTSGGLLMTAPSARADELVQALRTEGYPSATVIGQVLPFTESFLLVRP